MTVATDDQPRGRPMAANAAHQATQMTADFVSRRCFARSQQHRDRTGGGGLVDVDRQEAAFVVMGVEQRKLLMAVHDIDGVIDVQRDSDRRAWVAGAIGVDHRVGHAHHLTQTRRTLPTRHRRLRAQIITGIRQTSAGQFEAGVGAQMIEIVGVLVTAGNGEHARAQNIDDTVCHQQRIARIGNQTCQAMGNPDTPLGSSQKHHTAIRGETPTIERSSDFLASDGWKPERLSRIVVHGGCGSV